MTMNNFFNFFFFTSVSLDQIGDSTNGNKMKNLKQFFHLESKQHKISIKIVTVLCDPLCEISYFIILDL